MKKRGRPISGDAAIKGNLLLDAWNEIKHPSRPRVTFPVSEISDVSSPGWAHYGYSEAEPSASFARRVSSKNKDKGSYFIKLVRQRGVNSPICKVR